MTERENIPAPSGDKLLPVVEQMLAELRRGGEDGERPTKDDLLGMLSSGHRKLNLFFIKHLPREAVTALRRDDAWREKLHANLRQTIIGIKPPLLDPPRVKKLIAEAGGWPMAEVRKDPDLWAARILAALPVEPEHAPPIVALRDMISRITDLLLRTLPKIDSIEQLDAVYLYFERELASTPPADRFVTRALNLFRGQVEDPGEVFAFYRLMAMRVPDTLENAEPSKEKDRILMAIQDAVDEKDPGELRLIFKKRAMARADELMREAENFDELLELRFFFDQIGERSNRKLLNAKAGELAREMNVRAEGYELLGKLDMEELDEQGLLELVPAVMGRTETFVQAAPRKFIRRLMKFYLETAVPLLRSLRDKPEKVPRLIQNFKRRVGLLNRYDDLDDVAQTMQRKMVLAVCSPRMLTQAPERILPYLTRMPPEFYPPEVMKTIREMVRERGEGAEFTAGDVLRIFAAYPPAEGEEEESEGRASAEEIERLIRSKQGDLLRDRDEDQPG